MSKIIVAGAGHGGVVAAMKLARAGHDVTIFEKSKEGCIGLPQSDVAEKSAFVYADIPLPDEYKTVRNVITFVPDDNTVAPLTIPAMEAESILVDRNVLINHLLSLATEAGAKVVYEAEIISPIVLGNRVCGIKTANGDFYCDLVIDACGAFSPVRSNLPEYMCVNREIQKYDIINTYRGYFNKIPGIPDPETTYNIYLRDNGSVGFSWLVTEEEQIDVLIGRFYEPEEGEILSILQTMHEENPHMGRDLLKCGKYAKIPVCQPLSILVAEGYAAIGDCAFMTVPLKGSGIAYSIKAGKILADCIEADQNGYYNAKNLWEYEKRFFKEIGFPACRMAILKNLLHYMTVEQVNNLFAQNLVTTEEIAKVMNDKLDAVLNTKGITTVKDKMKLVRDNPLLKEIITNIAMWMGRFAVIEAGFPGKYDEDDIKKWSSKYNEFFDSIKAE